MSTRRNFIFQILGTAALGRTRRNLMFERLLLYAPGQNRNKDNRTVSEHYHDFVTAVIPLTKSLAKEDAEIRETKLVVNRTTEVQTALARATDRFSTMTTLIAGLEGLDGVTDIKKLLEQLVLAQQLLNLDDDLHASLETYKAVVAGASIARSFEDYDISRVYLELPPPDVELLDGVYVEIGDPITALFYLGKSIWQAITNDQEERHIKEDADRLRRERCTTEEYRSYAKDYAQKLAKDFADLVALYSAVLAPLDNFHQKWLPALAGHAGNAQTQLVQLAANVVAEEQEQARVRTRELLAPISEQVDRLNMSSRANLRLVANIHTLENTCNDFCALTVQLEADLALAELMGLTSTQALVDRVRQLIRQHPKDCSVAAVTHRPPETASRARFLHRVSYMSSFQAPEQNIQLAPYSCAEISGGSISLCNALSGPGTSGSPSGVGPCYSSSTWDYAMCGASAAGWGGDGVDAWADGRAIVAGLQNLPGTYNEKRGQYAGQILEATVRQLQQRSADLEKVVKDFESSARDYKTKTLAPAVNDTAAKIKDAQQATMPKLATIVTTPKPVPVDRPPQTALVSGALKEQIGRIQNSGPGPMDQWNSLRPLWDVYQYRLNELSPSDRAAVIEVAELRFDANGLIKANIVGATLGTAAKALGNQLQSHTNDPQGRLIRNELNRGLVALSSTPSDVAKGALTAGVGLALAADTAAQQGNSQGAHDLLQLSARSIDLAYGMIPVLGSINDAEQIVYGIATGYDYTGHRMETADYVLRSLGIAVGVLPLGAATLQVGGVAVTNALLEGGAILRETSVGQYVVSLSGDARLLALHLTESVGEWYGRNVRVLFTSEELALRTADLVHTEGKLVQKIPGMVQGGAVEDYVVGILDSPKNADRILVGTATDAAYRIPDVLNKAEGFLAEIKSNRNLSLTDQISDFLGYCRGENPPLKFRLYIMPDTTISADLEAALLQNQASVYEVTPNGLVERILH